MLQRLKLLFDLAWRANWRLAWRTGSPRHFLCRGRVRLALDRGARLAVPKLRTLIGQPLMGGATDPAARTVISAGEASELRLDGATIGRGAILAAAPGARLSIGPRTYVNNGTRIAASKEISIGADCAISWNVTIIDDDGHGLGEPPYSAPVTIEDRVWIGCNATILKGVRLGTGSVVAAGAVVTKSCPPGSLLAGVPARVIRSQVRWRTPEDA